MKGSNMMTSKTLADMADVYQQIYDIADKHDGCPNMAEIKFSAGRILNRIEFYNKWHIDIPFGMTLADVGHQCVFLTKLGDLTGPNKAEYYLEIKPTVYDNARILDKLRSVCPPDEDHGDAIFYLPDKAKAAFDEFQKIFDELYP